MLIPREIAFQRKEHNMPDRTPKYYIFSFLLSVSLCSFLLCSKNSLSSDGKVVSTNALTSKCGGFKSSALAKRSENHITPEDTAPCLEETLFWRYDSASKVLTFIHRCIQANCAAMLSINVVQNDNRFIISQTDARDPNGMARCDCTFDLYCEVPNISGTTVAM